MNLVPASPRDSVEAMEGLIRKLPFARALYEEHLADNDELLPHVLMADLRRLFVRLVNDRDQAKIQVLLDALEALAASPSDSIQNVVDVSFVEDAYLDPREREALLSARSNLGPATAASLARTEEFFRAR
jgi:hypothetical protein